MSRIVENAGKIHCGRRLTAAAGLAAAALSLAGCACSSRPDVKAVARYAAGGLVLPGPQPSFGPLPEGVTALLPAFDGDAFLASLPVRPQEDLDPEAALQEIAPVLRALGFQRSLDELGRPQKELTLPAPDLAGLAEEVCGELSLQRSPPSREVCAAMRSGAASAKAEEVLQSAYGIGFAELKSGFERATLQYSFRQEVDGIPIEGAGVVASRLEGESTSTLHGALFNRFVVVNRRVLQPGKVLESAPAWRTLGEGGPVRVIDARPVLLPAGSGRLSGEPVPALRHAWRAVVAPPGEESWLAWIDAETGGLLGLVPQFDGAAVTVKGERWRRDPGSGTEVRTFEVSPVPGGPLILQLDGVFKRVDRKGNESYGDGEVSIPGGGFASAIHDESKAVCGGNPDYLQVHAYSHLYSFWKMVVDSGTYPTFPERPVRIWIDHSESESMAFYDYDPDARDASSILRFPAGNGFVSGCPNAVDKRLNGVQDATTLAHEMAHLSVKRLQDRRPDWCTLSGCPTPFARLLFHDFADAMAAAYASTNCISGWTDKNLGGPDKTRYCTGSTSETSGLPRLADVAKDRFPEHRYLELPKSAGPYADGQIAAAAIWRVRQGLRSKEQAFGTVELWQRLHRAIWNMGVVPPICTKPSGAPPNLTYTACDRDIYRYLHYLEGLMVAQQVSGIGHLAGKVVSGWAEAGIFLVPMVCLDGNPATKNPASCHSGEGGGDAAIQVLDRDPTDDPKEDGVTHPEWDYLKRGGLPPRFRVWTGPRFRFDAAGKAVPGTPAPCHSRFQVEAASDAGFTANFWKSGVGTASGCYAELDLPVLAWSSLRGTGGEARIYYRVRTWDAAGGSERISTSPGAGAFKVPPPFVVVNGTGRP